MRKRQAGRLTVYGLVLLLSIWPIWQVIDSFQSKMSNTNPTHLLYQVSLFQMELLSSYLQQTREIKDSAELESLKQSLYSANYTHERLALAVGSDHLAVLSSMNQLMQYVLRLQVGGHRVLKADEKQTLLDAATQFQDIYAAYGELMSSRGSIISSQQDKLIKKDESLSNMIRKKLLQ
jgi:hypothetical protein